MIRLPKEIAKQLKHLGETRIKAYLFGHCVREGLRGSPCLDWDIYCLCKKEEVEVLRTGGYKDDLQVSFTFGSLPVEKFLQGQGFTINAMAYSGDRGIIDPFGGQEDLKRRLVRTTGEAEPWFKAQPLEMMEGILLAATLGFDLHRETYEGMCASARALDLVEGTLRREVFCEILIAPHGGKGMRMLAGADLMPAIIGELAMKLNRRQREQFSSLCDNIDKTKPVLSRRLGLFYTAFEGKKGEAAMAHLGYEAELEQHILDGLRLMDKLHFLRTPLELKDFLAKVGRERYDYLDNLAKAQRMVYDTSEMKILARKAYMEQLLASREPIFVSDLCVDKQTLLREGLPEEEVEKILLMLTDIVHRKPKENTEVALINYAKKLSKNKFFAKTRKVKWLR